MPKHGIDQRCTRRTPLSVLGTSGVRLGRKGPIREHIHGLNLSISCNKIVFSHFRLQILSAAYFAIFSFAQ